jgi:exopolysaccharide biosynthesis predicted pyruvyltransferase EpsI
MNNTPKIYLGNAEKKNDGWYKGYLKISELKKIIESKERNNNYIKININIREEADQYGNQMTISLDTWKPEKQENQTPF